MRKMNCCDLKSSRYSLKMTEEVIFVTCIYLVDIILLKMHKEQNDRLYNVPLTLQTVRKAYNSLCMNPNAQPIKI